MKYLYNILLILSTVFLFSCQENDELAGGNEIGYLRLTVANDVSTTTRADIPENYNPEQIAVQIIDSDGSVVEETDDFSEWKDKQIEVPAGNYTIKASSANWDGGAAGFDAPYYTGSTEVKVLGSQEVNATVTCTLANVKVTVNYDDELLAKVKSVATVVRSEDRIYQQNFSSTEKRSAYYPATALVAEVTVINNDGESNTLSQELGGDTGVQARDHFILNIHAQETGPSNINVTVDPTTHEYSYTFNVSTVPTNGATVQTGIWETAVYLRAENVNLGTGVSAEGIKFQYREAVAAQTKATTDDEGWIDVETKEENGVYTALITNLTPGTEYESRLVNDADAVIQEAQSFSTIGEDEEEKPTLYNGDFEFWSQSGQTIYPDIQANAGNTTSFWNTSNPGTTQGIGAIGGALNPTTSITSPVQNGTYAAQLKSAYKIIAFAAASLYTGNFGGLDGASANMEFGKPFTGRPTALHGYYKYTPVVMNHVSRQPAGANLVEGETMDRCAIFIALATKTFTFNNNNEDSYIDYANDSAIIAYGELPSGAATTGDGFTEFTIPLTYKEESIATQPTHIIIVCSASKYGDYMTGGEGSTLLVDNFSLVYDGTPTVGKVVLGTGE